MASRIAKAGIASLGLVLVAGCQPTPAAPVAPAPVVTSATASPTPTVRDFTVTTIQKPTTFDPAMATTTADATVALDVFQRLMIVHSNGADLKPDAASDCQYTGPTEYECKLQKDLTFSNGHPVTATDVKFSIERAYRLHTTGTSISLFEALQSVEIVDDQTVRFELKWPDNQFGHALATPAASIVDHTVYNPDAAAPLTQAPVGSGPFTLEGADPASLTYVARSDYKGATKPNTDRIKVTTVENSSAAEALMNEHKTDIVWRSLDAAAQQRVVTGATAMGMRSIGLPDTAVVSMSWNAASPVRARADVRAAVATALQGDRTLASIVPPSVAGYAASFPVGGVATPTKLPGERLTITLSYPSTSPGLADLASILRSRIEANAGMSVRLQADAPNADLVLTDAGAWVNSARGWSQRYLDAPLPGSQAKLAQLTQDAEQASDLNARAAIQAELQHQAAADLTVLPVSLRMETLYVGKDVTIAGDPYGPCWQLGLWSFGR